MKRELLDKICCPVCRSGFDFSVCKEEAGIVREAVLSCPSCREFYPVMKGVPRILPRALRAELVTGYREFLAEYRGRIPFHDRGGDDGGRFVSESKAIGKGFDIEWRAHNKVLPEHEFEFIHVLGDLVSKENFKGKTVLDAGCGQGRFMYYSREYGASEIHGFDLSESVLVAQENLKGLSNTHLIQASIYNLPYRIDFDLAYSIGVIHHLPDPVGGFAALVELVKPGGELFIWVYGQSGIVPFLRFLRVFSLRLPLGFMKYASAIPATIIYGTNRVHDLIERAGLRRLAGMMPFTQYDDRGFNGLRYGVCFDHLTTRIVNYYSETELQTWINRDGFSAGRVSQRYPGQAGSSWRVWARKKP